MNRREIVRNIGLMLGGAFSAPTLNAMNHWDSATKTQSGSFGLSETQLKIVSEIAEIIIPKTDTPGAKEVAVPAFIMMMITDCYREPEQKSFLEGLATMESVKFLNLSSDEKKGVLKLLEQETKKNKGMVTPFWRLIKELTLLGYFTSEAGIKASFEYVQIPGKLELIKMKPGQKSYAY